MDGQSAGSKPLGGSTSASLLLVSTVLLVLSQSPHAFGHLATIALVPWLLVSMRTTPLRALLIGGGFGIGYGIAASFWIFDALAGQGFHGARRVFAAVAVAFWAKGTIFAVTGWAVSALRALRFLREKNSASILVAPALLFGLIEFWMSHSPWGLPLLLLGHSQSTVPGTRQLAVAVGVPGISAFLFAVNLAFAMVIANGKECGQRRNRRHAVAFATSWLFALVTGRSIAEAFVPDTSTHLGKTLLVVQPKIDHHERWDPHRQGAILDVISGETSRAIAQDRIGPDVILWPESLLAVPISPGGRLGRRLQDQIDRWGIPVVAGLVRGSRENRSGATRLYRNSVVWWSPHVGPVDWQDKVRAIPIVESSRRFWGQDLIGWWVPGVPRSPRVVEAIEAKPLRGEFTLSPALCFEILFPGIVDDRRDEESLAIINLADDSWVRGEAVDEQMIASATFRAIEQRLAMIRVSNGGMSVEIDRFGSRLGALPAETSGQMLVKVQAIRGPSLIEKTAVVSPSMVAYLVVSMIPLRKCDRGSSIV